jgi:hypothetical protein
MHACSLDERVSQAVYDERVNALARAEVDQCKLFVKSWGACMDLASSEHHDMALLLVKASRSCVYTCMRWQGKSLFKLRSEFDIVHANNHWPQRLVIVYFDSGVYINPNDIAVSSCLQLITHHACTQWAVSDHKCSISCVFHMLSHARLSLQTCVANQLAAVARQRCVAHGNILLRAQLRPAAAYIAMHLIEMHACDELHQCFLLHWLSIFALSITARSFWASPLDHMIHMGIVVWSLHVHRHELQCTHAST